MFEALDLNIHASERLVLGHLARALGGRVRIDGAPDGGEHEVVARAEGLVEITLHFIGFIVNNNGQKE